MGVYAITGATTGIGAATRKLLQAQGHEVINIDIKDGDITADLAVKEQRERAIAELNAKAPDGLDCFIACAGVGPSESADRILSLNYFGARDMTEAAYPLLMKKKGVALVVSSNSANMTGLNEEIVAVLCDEGDEEKAQEIGRGLQGPAKQQAYQGSKFAIGKWVRRVSGKWAARGLRINAIAPGATMTPLMERGLADPDFTVGMKSYPIPTTYANPGTYMTPEEVADVMVFMVGPGARGMSGAVVYADGGTDALLRTEKF